ncbi:hypothetical protein HKX48_005105 [Thoreauomyces humboldtii]|nr:hypothetical protein HKX48_005105 [Thoreauomyces humboldtii]
MHFTSLAVLAIALLSATADAQYIKNKQCALPYNRRVNARYICCAAPASQASYNNYKVGVNYMHSMGCDEVILGKNRVVTGSGCGGCDFLGGWKVDGEFDYPPCPPGSDCS